MFTELVDTLRCIEEHEESWLVAAADRTEGRHIMTGVLGCPGCHARYDIERGIADFAGAGNMPVVLEQPGLEPTDELALKLAAMLDLTDRGGYVILMGRWTRLAGALRSIVPVSVVALNPLPDVEMGEGVSGVRAFVRVPMLAGSAHGVALDSTSVSANDALLMQSAVASVKPGGRVVGPIPVPMPSGVTELLRDDEHWVGARETGRPLLQIVRAPG
jgi:uncharacterized protein YbaR (Trm112 family)